MLKHTSIAAVLAAALCAGDFAYGASFNTVYSFKGGTDEAGPLALTSLKGTLYGATVQYPNYIGTVFALTTSGTETVLHHFSCCSDDGGNPLNLITMDGYLFGTTEFGGSYPRDCEEAIGPSGCGNVFGIAPSTGEERIVKSFSIFGTSPNNLVDLNGTLYGVLGSGYDNTSYGVVFKLQGGVETDIYSFKNSTDGANPTSLIRIGSALYGATLEGSVFKLTTDGTITVLRPADGKSVAGPLLNGGGELYAAINPPYGTAGFGEIIKIKGAKVETLYAFKGGNDGANPTSLTKIGNTIYGTTSEGGAVGDGTLFSLTKTGQEAVLHSFLGTDGNFPGSLINVGGTLYGVTWGGGITATNCNTYGCGTVFSYTP